MKVLLLASAALGALTIDTIARAADAPPALVYKAPPGTSYQDPPVVSLWEVDVGLRYWYSTGQTQKTLDNVSGNIANSRLTYSGLNANSGEAFLRADHWSGFFLKGYVGAGDIFGGKLTDEDFPPNAPGGVYSSTNSSQRNGTLNYFDVDAGLTVYKDRTYRIGAFAGYNQWNETLNGFGCTSNVPGSVCDPPFQQPASVLTITQQTTWHSVRIGFVGDAMLTDRLKVTGEVAYVPRTYLTAADTHWLRIGVPGGFTGPTPEDGRGSGVQLEALLTYQANDWLTLGIGGRYWYLSTDTNSGDALFDLSTIAPKGSPQPVGLESQRYGAFAQASICMTCLAGLPSMASASWAINAHASAPRPPAPYSWTGFYVGLNAGTGFSGTSTSLSSILPEPALFGATFGTVPQSIALPADGFIGGGQAGFNYQHGYLVLGIESDISYSTMHDHNNVVTFNGASSAEFTQDIGWIGTLRGRIGVAPAMPMKLMTINNVLFYGTGGLAYGKTDASVALSHPAGACEGLGGVCGSGSLSQISIGWTAGGGVETVVWRNITLKGEYLFVDLGHASDSFGFAGFGTISASTHFAAQIVRLGLNYNFAVNEMAFAVH